MVIPKCWNNKINNNSVKNDYDIRCPICGCKVTYVGLVLVDCSNPDCQNCPPQNKINPSEPYYIPNEFDKITNCFIY